MTAVRIAADPDGRGWRLGVIAKRTWTVFRGQGGLSPMQVPLVEEPLYDDERAVLLHDVDVMLNRKKADIVVDGHVYPPDGRTPFDFGIQVGSHQRLARAFGPRRVTRDASGKLRFSQPALASKIPLGWESAYGGVDLAARADIGDPFEFPDAGIDPDPRFGLFAYPRNPVGKGYVIEPTPAAIEACELPLIEAPESFLTPDTLVRGDFVRWPHGPAVAGFGWLSYGYFPRSAALGAIPLVYDGSHIPPEDFLEIRTGELRGQAVKPQLPLAERLCVSVAQSSAIGMRANEIKPGDVAILHGLHPRERNWKFQIPKETPRVGIKFPNETPLQLSPATIRTMFVQPDLERLTLVWTAYLPLPVMPGATKLENLQHVVLWES